ncbi:MAG: glycoside hydrolase family 99-like domain-containing protein, partial [Anaerolineae bacterium]|nr:glycoside hydrolase family 99-like domain-containing protein [Anaerolineae bacterium]
ALMRRTVQDTGFADLTIMGEHRLQDPQLLYQMVDAGFDASIAYCWHPDRRFPDNAQAVAYQLDIMRQRLEKPVLPFVPTASMGWDPWPWRSDNPNTPWVNPDTMLRWLLEPPAWRELLAGVKDMMDQNQVRMLLLDNWNEWAEGHYIAPHAYGGFKYLQAVREVFTERDNLPDYRSPQQLGFGPYAGL